MAKTAMQTQIEQHDSISPSQIIALGYDSTYKTIAIRKSDITRRLTVGSPTERLANAFQNSVGITEIFNVVVLWIFAVSLFVRDPISQAFDIPRIIVIGFPVILGLMQALTFLFAALQKRAYVSFASFAAWLLLFGNIARYEDLPVRPKLVTLAMAGLSFCTFIALLLLVQKRDT